MRVVALVATAWVLACCASGLRAEEHGMHGMFGSYSMTRDGSGTGWQPDDAPMIGLHKMKNDWMVMLHGFATAVYDHQGGTRGDDDLFSSNMVMAMAQRPLGRGTLGLRGMASLEPATIGDKGYPLLLQTGETADGKVPLIDRQHAHDLFMELAVTYSIPVGRERSVFFYLGMPGEPALGPTAFMHRFSGVDNPEAPISHHWLDSTHITYGVATVGCVWKDWKVDGSVFTGREPDQHRWGWDEPEFDSHSLRVTFNPTAAWSAQVSWGDIHSPEQLELDVDQRRVTASASYQRKLGAGTDWQTTFAWGQNRNDPGRTLDAFLVESAANVRRTHTVFARAERVEKDELFLDPDPLADSAFTVTKASVGYIYDYRTWRGIQLGIGALGSTYFLPSGLDPSYGDSPLSALLFARARLGS
jgi:hypothetical protein